MSSQPRLSIWRSGKVILGKGKPLCILVLLSFLSLSMIGCAAASVTLDITEIEEISGASFCSKGEVVDIQRIEELHIATPQSQANSSAGVRHSPDQIRKAILSNFPNNSAPCVDLGAWPDSVRQLEHRPLKKVTGFIEIDEAKIPLVLTYREDAEAQEHGSDRRLIVRLSGGPGGIPIGAMSDFFILHRTHDVLIDFMYNGSGVNLIYPGPNFHIASTQVHFFVTNLRRRNPNAEIVLIGESLGGVIALASMGETSSLVNKIILINPIASSMRSFVEQSHAFSADVEPQSMLEKYRVLDSHEDDWSTRNIRQLNRIDVLANFFSDEELDDAIADRISRISDVPILIIYGDSDPIIDISSLEELRTFQDVSLEEIDGMGHTFSNLGHISDMKYAIETFLE